MCISYGIYNRRQKTIHATQSRFTINCDCKFNLVDSKSISKKMRTSVKQVVARPVLCMGFVKYINKR